MPLQEVAAYMKVLHERVAGIDVHKDMIKVAIRSPGAKPWTRRTEILTFGTFYGVLRAMARDLRRRGVTHVVMEASGVCTEPVYYALCELDFTLAGMLIRRVVPAIAATMAAWAGLALAVGLFLRQHYLAPLIAHNPNLPGSAWIISSWYTERNGKPLSQAAVSQFLQGYHPAAPTQVGPNTLQTNLDPVGYITQHGYQYWVSYQPASRFWPFQWIEGGYLLGLSVVLIAATIWLVHRRAA